MLAAHAFFDTTDVAVPAWDDITAVDVRSFADLTGEIDARELAVGDKTAIDIRAFGFGDEPTAVDAIGDRRWSGPDDEIDDEIDLDAFALEPAGLGVFALEPIGRDAFAFEPTVLAAVVDEVT